MDAARIRLFEPAAPEAETAAAWTLRDAWERGKRRELQRKGARKSTLAGYKTHLGRWDEYWSGNQTGKDRLPTPTLATIDNEKLELWRNWLLMRLTGQNPELTANNHLTSVHAVLRWAEAAGRIDKAPHLERLPAVKVAKRLYFRYDELERIYEACSIATWPTTDHHGAQPLPFSPACYWRAAVALFFNYGFRTQELIRFERDHESLTWRQICYDHETPAEDGRAENRWGWLWYVPQKQRRKKPEPLILPLNQITAAHVRSITPPGGADPGRPLLDWPLSNVALYGQWYRILAAAEVAPKADLVTGAVGRYHLRHFRKTCTTWLNRHRPGIAPLVTGHAERALTRNVRADATLSATAADGPLSAVSAQHYDNQELAVAEAINTLPQPDAFRRILAGPRYSQLELF